MPRLRAVRTLTLTALVAATLLSPVAAHAAEPVEDWRADACRDAGYVEDAATGAGQLVVSSRVPVDGLPGVEAGVDRLDFSGVTCEVLHVAGAVPRGASLSVFRNQWCAGFDYALDGVPQRDGHSCSAVAGPFPLYSEDSYFELPDDVEVLIVETFRAHESEVVEDEPGLPPKYVGATLTTDHTGSSWQVVLRGTLEERRTFDRTRTTDRAARAAYVRKVARATRDFEARVARIRAKHLPLAWKAWKIDEARAERRETLAGARRVQRLALRGVRLVVRDFYDAAGGTLPPAA